jgi:ring-1,2-phenylacetyl-CoA epoxidase subunit PaaD
LDALRAIPDPEIPVLSLVELGVVRSVELSGAEVRLEMTPTFSACPAYLAMEATVRERLTEMGASQVTIERVLDPPWSTEWLSDSAREKLRQFGIASPPRGTASEGNQADAMRAFACPYCGSNETRLTSVFGCTLCRSMAFCDKCRQPFEQLKPL